jgi:pyruvate/2-oxoglutarate dehydrogenase complex dihydrolipoamide acyltransferase (E2) component
MKPEYFVLLLTMLGLASGAAYSESLSKSLGIIVYPAEGQDAEQQGRDDYECFSWAKDQTGYDPMNPPEVVAEAPDQGPSGARLRGAARGAAGGAIVGEIADDNASDGAAIGATVGAMRAGRQDRQSRQAQAQQAEQAAQQQAAASADHFKGAYATCMEARRYAVNY